MQTDLRTRKNPTPGTGLPASHTAGGRADASLPNLESLAAEAIRLARIAAAVHMYEAASDPTNIDSTSEASSFDPDVLTFGRIP